MKKALIVLVLLFATMIPIGNVLAEACDLGGRVCVDKCSNYNITAVTCTNYFEAKDKSAKLCQDGGVRCEDITTCTQSCGVETHCTDTRVAVATCSNYSGTVCGDRYQTGGGTPYKLCGHQGYPNSCVTGDTCIPIPEFMGIEFGEMELSTGIIALIAAIALPTFLFKRKTK